MILSANTQSYSTYGTHLPTCTTLPFIYGVNQMNLGGIGISSTNSTKVRVVGIKLNGANRYFSTPVIIIDRTLYGVGGVVPNVSELVGNAVRTIYQSVFNLTNIPFLFTVNWDSTFLKNFTSHAIDNSTHTNHNNNNCFMIYQFLNSSGVWGADYLNTFNSLDSNFGPVTPLSINSDVYLYIRFALSSINKIEIASLVTAHPDIILEGLPINPIDIEINLTYLQKLSESLITQLLYPLLLKETATNCVINITGTINLNNEIKTQLQSLGWTVNI